MTDYEEQESIEYEEMARERSLANRRRDKRRRILALVGGFALAVLIAVIVLIITAGGWHLILSALGVSTEEWAVLNWAYLALGTHVIVFSAGWARNWR